MDSARLSLNVCNVKGRFRVQAPNHLLFDRIARPAAGRITNNFSFVTLSGLKYSVFTNSTWVNVTGLSNFEDLAPAAHSFCNHFGVPLEPESLKTDNSTVVGALPGVDRALLAQVASRKTDGIDWNGPFVVVARTRWFPSIHLRPNNRVTADGAGDDARHRRDVLPRLASCTLFPTGKIVILGARNHREAKFTYFAAGTFVFGYAPAGGWEGLAGDCRDAIIYGQLYQPGSTALGRGVTAANVAERASIRAAAAGFVAAHRGSGEFDDDVKAIQEDIAPFEVRRGGQPPSSAAQDRMAETWGERWADRANGGRVHDHDDDDEDRDTVDEVDDFLE